MKGKDNKSLNKVLKKRTFSFLIDLLAIHYINKGFILSYERFLKSFFLLPLSISQEISENLGKLSLVTLPFIFLAYFTMMYYLTDGQTIGKFLLNLNIVLSTEEKNENEEEKIKENKSEKKVGRNEKCPCGSGKKFKHCHGNI